MAKLVGVAGSVRIASNTIASLDSWKVSIENPTVEGNEFGSSWTQVENTIKKWSGELSGQLAISADTNGQAVLYAALLSGNDVALKLYVSATEYYTGNCKISKMDIDTSITDLVKISLSIVGNGAFAKGI